MSPDLSPRLQALVDAIAEEVAVRMRRNGEKLIDLRELAARVGMSPRGVPGLGSRGELPRPLLHTAGVTRWSWDQVVKFLEANGNRPRRGRGRHCRRHEPQPNSNDRNDSASPGAIE